MIDFISKSFKSNSFVHFLMNFFLTASSALNNDIGIALSLMAAPIGFLAIINEQLSPFPYTTSSPRNSDILLADVIATPFYASYSSTYLLSILDSPI